MGEGREAASSQVRREPGRGAELHCVGVGWAGRGGKAVYPSLPQNVTWAIGFGASFHKDFKLSTHLGPQSSCMDPERASDPPCSHLLPPSSLSGVRMITIMARDLRNAGTHLGSHSCVCLPSLGIPSWWGWGGGGSNPVPLPSEDLNSQKQQCGVLKEAAGLSSGWEFLSTSICTMGF